MRNPAASRFRPPMFGVLLVVASALASNVVLAQDDAPPPSRDDRASQARRADHRALANAVRRVERETGGEVLSAERVQSDGHDVSRVKVVDASGRVRVYMGDPQPRQNPPERSRRKDSDND